MGKKKILASILIKTGAIHALHALRQSVKKELPVLAYHRILDTPDFSSYPYDKDVIDGSPESFEQQMLFIKKHYNPISIEKLHDFINKKGVSLPKKPILITFDDGFDDNYYHAFPILKKYNIPATIFIATQYIDTNESFWFERLSRLILTTTKTNLSIEEFDFHRNITKNVNEKRKIYNECVELLKYKNKTLCKKIINRLEKDHDIQASETTQKMSRPLTWKQCQEMADSVITIGSHGTSHTIFTQLTATELDDELVESKTAIAANTKSNAIPLSFPNGQKMDFNNDIVKAVKKHGYKLFFSYSHGTNPYKNIGKKALKRIHPPHSNDLKKFQLFLTLPEIF